MTTPWIAAIVVLWVVVVLLAIIVLGVLRRTGGILERAERHFPASQDVRTLGLDPGSRANKFRGFFANGEETSSDELIREETLLLFMDVNCGPCAGLARELDEVEDMIADVPFFVVLNRENPFPAWMPQSIRVVYQRDHEISDAFSNTATPQAYVVDARRRILGRLPVNSLESLTELVKVNRPKRGDRTREHVSTGTA